MYNLIILNNIDLNNQGKITKNKKTILLYYLTIEGVDTTDPFFG